MSLKPTGIMAGLEYFTVHQRSDRYVPPENTSGAKSRKMGANTVFVYFSRITEATHKHWCNH